MPIPFPAASPAPPTTPTLPAPALSFEERVKRELHPLDAFARLLEAAAENRPPGPEDAFRFRWFGLHDLAPRKDGFRLRVRVPGGRLTSAQLHAVADVAQEFASGCAEINPFAGLDIETLALRDAPEALCRLEAAGLPWLGNGGDAVVALLTDPLTGLDPDEPLDVWPLAQSLAAALAAERRFADLPGEVTVALSGGGPRAARLPGDVYLRAVRAVSGDAESGGVHFRVWLNGAAEDLGALLPVQEAGRFCLGLLDVYRLRADRSERANAGFFSFAERRGARQILEETESRLSRPLARVQPVRLDATPARAADENVFLANVALPQTLPRLRRARADATGRRLLSGEWHELAAEAERTGNGEARLTVAGEVWVFAV